MKLSLIIPAYTDYLLLLAAIILHAYNTWYLISIFLIGLSVLRLSFIIEKPHNTGFISSLYLIRSLISSH